MDDPTRPGAGFLLRQSDASWWHVPGLVQCDVAYDLPRYQDALFPRLGVAWSESLELAVPKRRAEFLAGRYCAHQALHRLDRSGPVGIGPDRSPAWPVGVTGSISHSAHHAVAIATCDPRVIGVGIDIEAPIAAAALDELRSQILTPHEQARLRRPELTPQTLLTLVFSTKESFFKALYPSVNAYFGFEAVSVTDIDTRACEVHFVLETALAGGRWLAGHRFVAQYREPAPGVLATLVVVRAGR